MSTHVEIVKKYIDGFREGDSQKTLSCLTDDVTWNIYGHKSLRGLDQFAAELKNDAFEGNPELQILNFVENANTVAIQGSGRVKQRGGDWLPFVFSEFFVFTSGKVETLDTYHIFLSTSAGPEVKLVGY